MEISRIVATLDLRIPVYRNGMPRAVRNHVYGNNRITAVRTKNLYDVLFAKLVVYVLRTAIFNAVLKGEARHRNGRVGVRLRFRLRAFGDKTDFGIFPLTANALLRLSGWS